jgi:YggT family protein
MMIVSQFFSSLALLFSLIFKILYFLLVIRIILSWFRPDPFNELVSAIYRATDPLLLPLRRLPLQYGGIDFSPILVFLVLTFLDSFIVGTLRGLAIQAAS